MIDGRVNLSMLDRVLRSFRKPDLRPAWREAKKPLRADIKAHRDEQRGPDGAWVPRAPSTRARYGNKPRRTLGKVPTSQQSYSTNRSVGMRARVRFSELLRIGGTVGHGSRIPGRDFEWASKNALRQIADIVLRRLDKLWERG